MVIAWRLVSRIWFEYRQDVMDDGIWFKVGKAADRAVTLASH